MIQSSCWAHFEDWNAKGELLASPVSNKENDQDQAREQPVTEHYIDY